MCKTKHPIEIALKDLNSNIRITNNRGGYSGSKWLVWDTKEWIVYERKRYARNTTIIIKTDLIETAIKKLIEG